MTVQLSTALRNSLLDQYEAFIGTSAILKIRSGTQPATPETADSGTVLVTVNAPSDWMAAAASASKAKAGTWQDPSADATGTPGHYRLYASDGVTCHEQGTVTLTGGGGDMTLDDMSITAGQVVTITSWTKNWP